MQGDASSPIPIGTEFSVSLTWQRGQYEAIYRKPARRWDRGLPQPYDDPGYVLELLRAVLVVLGVNRQGHLNRLQRADWEQYPSAFLRELLVAIDADLRQREEAMQEEHNE